jgi:hypothetical protein
MSARLVRTDLGKWGRVTQTYEEHVHAVWVFRKPFLTVLRVWLRGRLAERGLGEKDIDNFWMNQYLPLAAFETRWHDYDKLFVPEDRLADLCRFSWHATPSDPANSAALMQVLQENTESLPGDEHLCAKVLRAANFAHEGLFTPDKAKEMHAALSAFGRAVGWPLDDGEYSVTANIHLAALRAADAVASAQERPAFKDDVSRFTNLVAQFTPGSALRIVSVAFETSFGQSPVGSVLAGYYRFYDSAYKGLLKILQDCGHVVGDNTRTLLGIALSNEPSKAMQESWWNATRDGLGLEPEAAALLKNLCSFEAVDVDPAARPADFDAVLRRELLNGLGKAHINNSGKHGFPCGSCGRRVVRRPLDEAHQSLKKEVASPESRGDFGFNQDVKRHLLGLETRIDKSKLLVCPDCDGLARLAPPEPCQAVVVIGGSRRKYERRSASLQLTSTVGDPLTQALFSFLQQQDVLARLANTVSLAGGESERIAGSAIIVRFTPSLAGLLNGFVKPVLEAMETQRIALPDAWVDDELECGLRVGAGALFMGGRLHDTVYLPGVYPAHAYKQRLELVFRLHMTLSKLSGKGEYERALYALLVEHEAGASARALLCAENEIDKILRGDTRAKLSLEEVLGVVDLVVAAPGAVEDLLRLRKVEGG